MRTRLALACAYLGMLGVGCDSAPLPSEVSVESTPSTAASDVESTTPASAPTGGRLGELTASEAALPAGTYTRTAFAPPITLTLEDGWRAVQLLDGFFDVQQDVGSPHVIAVQFANVEGVHGADGGTAVVDAAAAVETLRSHPGLTVLESSESRIGDLAGEQVTVENAGTAHASVIDVPPGPLGIDPGRRLWIAFFDTDDGLLAVMVGGSVERWDEALATAEPVLESVQIGP